MDEIDAKLLHILSENADTTATEMMAQVNLSIPAINKRISKLRQSGLIRKFTIVTLPQKSGKSSEAVILVVLLVWLINHTKIGMAMRAVSRDFETAQLMGIKINKVISATFIIGTFLAAVGSMLYFTNYPGVVPTSGGMPGLKAFVAAVFGGIGSIPGAVIGAFIIGICESIIKGLDTILVVNGVIAEQVGFSTFSDAFTFVLLIIILVFKPTGLFGEKTTDKV